MGLAVSGLGKIIRSVQAFGREFSRKPHSSDVARVPSIGVALGGGFARGIAHIGVLKVLEEEGVPIRVIASSLSLLELSEKSFAIQFRDDAAVHELRHFLILE